MTTPERPSDERLRELVSLLDEWSDRDDVDTLAWLEGYLILHPALAALPSPDDRARLAALGEAVERLEASDYWWVLGHSLDGYSAMLYAGDQVEHRVTGRPSVAAAADAAIAAALGDRS